MDFALGGQLTDQQIVDAYRAQGRDQKHRDLLAAQARQYVALRREFGQEPAPYPQAMPDVLAVAEAELEDRVRSRLLVLMGVRRERRR